MKQELSPVAYAGFWLRFWAYLLDLLIIHAVTAALLNPLFHLFSLPRGSGILSLRGVLGLLFMLAYFVLTTKITNGQTLGKMIFGLKVVSVNEEEETLTWGTVLFREGVGRYILQAIPGGVLYMIAGFTPKKQGLADMFADTYVVKEETVQLIKELSPIPVMLPQEEMVPEPPAWLDE